MAGAFSSAPVAVNPWLVVWRHPLTAFRSVLRRDPRRGVGLIAVIYGILMVALELMLEPQRLLSVGAIAVVSVFVGAFAGLFWLYLSGWVTQGVAWFFGGSGKRTETRAAIAWSSLLAVPAFVILIVWGWQLGAAGTIVEDDTTLLLLGVLVAAAYLYSAVSYVRFLAAAHGFSLFFAILAAIISLGLVIAGAVVIRTMLVQPFSIPSGSMQPNLLIGETVIATKWNYGYSRASAPFGLLGFIKGRKPAAQPRAGDVVVFEHPLQPGVIYVKRVIGMPGNRIAIHGGVLSIDGTTVQLADAATAEADAVASSAAAKERIETLPNGASYRILDLQPDSLGDEFAEITVPADTVFVLGDNRDNAVDSRFPQLGLVPIENIVGRMSLVLSSIDPETAVDDQSPFANIRLGRLFNWVR